MITAHAYNVTLTDADTEYSQVLPANAVRIGFQCRTAAAVRFAFVAGKVTGPTAPYLTLKSGQAFEYVRPVEAHKAEQELTLYLASSSEGVVVEILAWSAGG